MIFKNKKFYNSEGVEVPLQFGNKEQLTLMRKVEEMRDGVLYLQSIHCLCGFEVSHNFEPDKKLRCTSCGQKFQMFLFEEEIPCIKTV